MWDICLSYYIYYTSTLWSSSGIWLCKMNVEILSFFHQREFCFSFFPFAFFYSSKYIFSVVKIECTLLSSLNIDHCYFIKYYINLPNALLRTQPICCWQMCSIILSKSSKSCSKILASSYYLPFMLCHWPFLQISVDEHVFPSLGQNDINCNLWTWSNAVRQFTNADTLSLKILITILDILA